MFHRASLLGLGVMALMVLTGSATAADSKTHEGIVVKAGDGKLTMTDKDGKDEQSHTVAADAKITCDGKECKLDELKKGARVKVTIEKKDDKNVATKVEATKS